MFDWASVTRIKTGSFAFQSSFPKIGTYNEARIWVRFQSRVNATLGSTDLAAYADKAEKVNFRTVSPSEERALKKGVHNHKHTLRNERKTHEHACTKDRNSGGTIVPDVCNSHGQRLWQCRTRANARAQRYIELRRSDCGSQLSTRV